MDGKWLDGGRTTDTGEQVAAAVNEHELLCLSEARSNDVNSPHDGMSLDRVGRVMLRASLTRACILASFQLIPSKGSTLHAGSPESNTGSSHVLLGGNTCW